MKKCPNQDCGYVRQPEDDKFYNQDECPQCRRLYSKSLEKLNETKKQSKKPETEEIETKKLDEKHEGNEPGSKRLMTPCPHCKEEMDIDASHCPHCGKSGGFYYQYVGGGAGCGMLIALTVLFIWVSSEITTDLTGSILLSTCCCSPLFWGVVLPSGLVGAGVGFIVGAVQKKKIKNGAA
jgi:hypothetical protein